MITDAIMRTLALPFSMLLGVLPDVALPDWACSSWSGSTCLPAKVAGMGDYVGAVDKFLPIHEALGLVELYLGVVLAVLSFKVVVFVYDKVRG